MQSEEIRKRLAEVTARSGPWTADNIHLGDNVYTVGPARRNSTGRLYTGREGVNPRVRSLVQAAADLLGRPLEGLRVLDPAPGEGQLALEFALHGARVTVLEPRAAGQEMLRFLQEVFPRVDLNVRPEPVDQLHPDQHGTFDLIICAGVLDHLDAARLFLVARQLADVCGRLVLVDTYVSLVDQEAYVHHGRSYWGRTITTRPALHDAPAAPFWLTRPSLYNLLRHVGFTSVFECHNPMGLVLADRHTFAALKGERQTSHTAPLLNEPEEDWSEKLRLSAPPEENADYYHPPAELLAYCQHLQAECAKLRAQHPDGTHLSGLLRQLPRAIWEAIRRRFRGS